MKASLQAARDAESAEINEQIEGHMFSVVNSGTKTKFKSKGIKRLQSFAFKTKLQIVAKSHILDLRLQDRMVSSVVVVTFMLFPTCCEQAFKMFACTQIGNKLFMTADLRVEC